MFGFKSRSSEKISLKVGSEQKVGLGAAQRRGKRIVIVDDDQVVLKAFSKRLETDGFTVFSVLSCSDSLTVIRDEKPDLVLFDVNFPPEMGAVAWDGVALMQWMRYSAALQIPVVIITGSQDDSIRKRAMAAGAVGFFEKSQGYPGLLAIIDDALKRRAVSTVTTA